MLPDIAKYLLEVGRRLFPLKTTTVDILFLCSLSGRKFPKRVGINGRKKIRNMDCGVL